MTRTDDATAPVAAGSGPAAGWTEPADGTGPADGTERAGDATALVAGGTERAEDVRWLSEDQQRVWRSYLLGNALLSELLDADLRRHGVDLAEYEILVVLSEADEIHVRMSDLARAVHQSRSRLTHTITRMERAGLVRRTNCPTDRRGVWAELTEAGRDLLRRAAPEHVRAVRENFVAVISESDFAALGRAFAAVAERIAPRS